MKKIILTTTLVLLTVASALAQEQTAAKVHVESGKWLEVSPADAGFTVLMPGMPSKIAAPDGPTGVNHRVMALETKLLGYVLSFAQFPEEVKDPQQIKEMLDGGRDRGISQGHAKLISEKEIKLDDYSGREWQMELEGGLVATARAYWVKRWLYQVLVVRVPNPDQTAEEKKLAEDSMIGFLDSFTLSGDSAPK